MAWLGPLLKFLSWLGQALFAWKAGKDNERAKNAENTVEQITEANAPASDADVERVVLKYRRD